MAENGVVVIVHIHARIGDGLFRFALVIGGEVGHIAGVRALRIIEAVLFLVGIEVRAGAGEGRFAGGVLVNVKRVIARGQVHEVDLDADTGSSLDFGDDGGADALSFRVFQLDGDGFGGSESGDAEQGCG